MVSLCHGALMGVGAYAYAHLAAQAGIAPPLAMAAAVALTGATAWVIGAVCARSHGIYFIMATLAFGQMAYSYVFKSPVLGGDDGIGGIERLDLSAVGIDLGDSRSFALFCLAALAGVYGAAVLVLRSGLGRSLSGVMHNEVRMRALGLTIWRVKADIFGFSGMIAGLAGTLAAQHTMFISPGLLSWTVSGEALVVVILGGLGTLVGPLVGAAAFVVLKHEAERGDHLLAPRRGSHPDRRGDEPRQRHLRLVRGALGRPDRTAACRRDAQARSRGGADRCLRHAT